MRQMSLFGNNLSSTDMVVLLGMIEQQEDDLAFNKFAVDCSRESKDSKIEKKCLDCVALIERNIELLKRLSR